MYGRLRTIRLLGNSALPHRHTSIMAWAEKTGSEQILLCDFNYLYVQKRRWKTVDSFKQPSIIHGSVNRQ